VHCSILNPETHPAAQTPTVSTYGSALTLSYTPHPPASSPACSRRGRVHAYSREVAALCASRPLSLTVAPPHNPLPSHHRRDKGRYRKEARPLFVRDQISNPLSLPHPFLLPKTLAPIHPPSPLPPCRTDENGD
jgi:hypothetical protein